MTLCGGDVTPDGRSCVVTSVMLDIDGDDAAPSEARGWLELLFVERYAEMVRVASLLVGSRSAGEDLVQDAFVSLARRSAPLDDPSAAGGYLLRTVVNRCRSHHRRSKVERRHETQIPSAGASAENVAMAYEDTRLVREALAQLSVRQRACVICRFHLGLSPPEIADALDISENSVKTHLRRAHKRLAVLLQEPR